MSAPSISSPMRTWGVLHSPKAAGSEWKVSPHFGTMSPHLEQGGSKAELCCLGGMRHNQPVHRVLPRRSPSQTVTTLYSCPGNNFVTHTTIIPAVTLTSWPMAPESLEKNAKANPVQKEFISVGFMSTKASKRGPVLTRLCSFCWDFFNRSSCLLNFLTSARFEYIPKTDFLFLAML